MKRDHIENFKQAFVGRTCLIGREPPFWRADFGDQFTIAFRVPWRIVANGRVAFGDQDDGQLFGLAEPLDGEERAASVLGALIVRTLQVDEETGDLRIEFDGNTRIDVFNQSSGYEGWDAHYIAGGERWGVIAIGGGELAIVPG
ncbi:DUF6188 family protein [Sphingopyxis sp.]|jgi:hypothetical protein|uniref:DUF6188 family protein n=1 Tax=Sphingopyxis sp. TaxID=1908224 RepID=UPI003F706910